jgi:hypothetical protein
VSSSLVLTLDTAGPVVQWGTATGRAAGERLALPYTSNESIARAVLHLAGGRDLELTVGPSTLSVDLPRDIQDGSADVSVFDDLGNRTRSVAVVILTGGVVTPPPVIVGGGSGVAWPRKPRAKRKPTKVEAKRFKVVSRLEARALRDVVEVIATAVVANESFTRLSHSYVYAERSLVPTVFIERATDNAVSRQLRRSLSITLLRSGNFSELLRRDGPNLEALILLLLD